MSRPSRAENTKKCTKKCDTRAELLLFLNETYCVFFDVLVAIAVVVAVVVFKLPIKAWTAHLTKNSWINFWLPSFLSCCHLELGVNFSCRFVLVLSVSPFLIGQALWVASRFTPLMTQQLLARWVECVEFPPGVLNRILCGEAPPRDPTPYNTLLYTICDRKGYPFCIPFVDKWYPFYILMYLRSCYTRRC